MKIKNGSLLLIAFAGLMASCKNKPRQAPFNATFALGQVKLIHNQKTLQGGEELTLMTRFELNKKGMNAETSNYFQYQLGKKIKLVIDKDTLTPGLFYYIPLINETEKEIDSKFLISAENNTKTKQVIIDDTLFDFNKINISFK